jgi:predicted transcriptional regulator
MTLTLNIDPALAARVREVAAANGTELDDFAAAVFAEAVRQHEAAEADPDDALTEAQQEAVRQGLARGVEAEEAGRFRPFSEFATEQRSKYNLPPQ